MFSLATEQTNVEDVAAVLAEPSLHEVDQRWVALGGPPPCASIGELTVDIVLERQPKFQIVNAILGTIDLLRFDYLLLVDDDVVLPHGFVYELLTLQSSLGFSLAQPARTSTSYIDLPIVERQPGALARETSFVEIGPVLSIHRDAFDVALPFDLTSPMGWGYENVWALEIRKRGMRMGIIDAVPVDHSLRKSVEHYSWESADEGRRALLGSRPHLPLEECFRVHRVIPMTPRAPA